MALINADDLTLNAREAETMSEVIFERVFNESDLAEYHEVETGIDVKTQIAFAERLGLLGKKSEGCTPNEAGGFTLTEKFWTPVLEDFRLKHCQNDMPALLKLFRKSQRINPDFFDAVGTQEFGVIIAAVESALIENIHRKVWFNDTAAATISNSGVFTNGTDLEYFNSFDGLFKQIFTEVPSNAANRVAITANGGANYTAQALAEDAALAIFEKMVTVADERLVSAEDAFILASRTLADNYRATLRNKNLGSGFLEVVEEGRPKLYFDGIEVKVRYDWDRYIKQYQNNGTKHNLPHRAVLTTKSNIPVGTLSEDDLTKLDVFYDKTLKTNIMDAAYTLDAKHLEAYMTVAAY
ncbi:hypothetical protein AM493_13870 [Flavobacterium akiainvivens]|uniref:Uncharacterized protein n=1 Tax=Flavobacterium akiainvivens TaxID=1202724 RepID=A0A0M8MJC2_9FLAO|nr:hypothetical protein [Flavobacterium akiainvivens]KOS06997.1 hypothetical protein AM493_13870 [Flavobacterium akiainvivens]SFQ59384.1 hypothetical protein SAMN05444144_109103 [Flavobacterium akiainvivens]